MAGTLGHINMMYCITRKGISYTIPPIFWAPSIHPRQALQQQRKLNASHITLPKSIDLTQDTVAAKDCGDDGESSRVSIQVVRYCEQKREISCPGRVAHEQDGFRERVQLDSVVGGHHAETRSIRARYRPIRTH